MSLTSERKAELKIYFIKEYARLRVSEYLEKMIPEKKLRDNEEIRLYDNLMECMSLIDYANINMPESTERLIRKAKEIHEKELKRLIKEGKYKIL